MNRKLFASVALAATIGLGAITANAGSFTALVPPAGTYAAEALTAATPLTAPTVVYVMGVPRATSQNFTVIITTPAIDIITCGGGAPTLTGSAGFTVTLKRCGPNEVAFDVTVTAPTVVGATLTLTTFTLASHNLNVAGNSILTTWSIKDPGETSFIDNAGPLTFTVATSLNTVNVSAVALDTLTVTDVNCPAGPLFCFLPVVPALTVLDDTTFIARAGLLLSNNPTSAKTPGGVTAFDFTTTGGSVTVSIADTAGFGGLAAGGFCLDVNNDAVLCGAGEVMTVPAGGPATLTIAAAAFPAVGTTRAMTSSFTASGTTSLGTGRSFTLTGTVTPAVGLAHPVVAGFSPYWTWSANATVLQSPWMSTFTAPGYTNRFFLMNTGAVTVGFTATCIVEAGNTSTLGTTSGAIPGGGTVMLNATSVCAFSGTSRGAVIFVINSPAGNIKGTFQQVTPQNQVTDKALERPYLLGVH